MTEERAISELVSDHVITQPTPPPPNAPMSGRDFAQLLLGGVNVDVRATLNRSAQSEISPTLAAAAVNKLRLAAGATSFSHPAQSITREDAVTIALNAAALTGYVPPGPMPREVPRFDDEADFSSARTREAAHLAVIRGLISVGPDNNFQPKAPLSFGQAALMVNGLRAGKQSSDRE